MRRNVIYILALVNVIAGFALIYLRQSPFAGRNRKTK